MVKFELALLLGVLQRRIEKEFDATFELTCRPSDTKLFALMPDSERASYLKHVSMTFRIHLNHPTNNIQNVYLFFRNGLASDNSYTRLSSIEVGYINSGIFVPTFKHHFIGDLNRNIIGMISSFDFNTTEDMHDAVSDVATFICNHLNTLFTSVISIGVN